MIRIRMVPRNENPTPRTRRGGFDSEDEETDADDSARFLQGYLDGIVGEELIRASLGSSATSDLQKVTRLQLRVNTSTQSMLDIPLLLPSLQELCLDGSSVKSVRDLGTGLRLLNSLSLNSCELCDLDGIGAFAYLTRLSASNNSINDLTPLALHDRIQELILDGNKISDLSFADALSVCPTLTSLRLKRNPICRAPNYRAVIAALISSLTVLDDEPIASRIKVSNAMILEVAYAMQIENEEREDEMRLESCIFDPTVTADVVSDTGTASPRRKLDCMTMEEFSCGSELTHGSCVVLAGGMAAAMRRRRGKVASGGGLASSMDSCNDDGSEQDSMLAILDEARTAAKPASDRSVVPFLVEGDVTHLVIPSTSTAARPLSSRGCRTKPTALPESRVEIKASPRQNNSISRPQSAALVGSESSVISYATNASFKVAPASTPEDPSKALDSSSDSSEESDGSALLRRNRMGRSIVHRDLVRREYFDTDIVDRVHISRSVGVDSEKIAVNAQERRRLVATLAEGSSVPLAAPQGLSPDGQTGNRLFKPSTAMKAGRSMGFDLTSSLVAIDQWVRDVESDEEDKDEGVVGHATKINGTEKEQVVLSRQDILMLCSSSSSGGRVQNVREDEEGDNDLEQDTWTSDEDEEQTQQYLRDKTKATTTAMIKESRVVKGKRPVGTVGKLMAATKTGRQDKSKDFDLLSAEAWILDDERY